VSLYAKIALLKYLNEELTGMTTYEIPKEFELTEYPFELRNKVGHFLNTHMGKFTIPQIARELCVEEGKIAWVLSNLCELTTPEVVARNEDGEKYWGKALKLKKASPRSFSDKTIFSGRTSM
jgi:hypothetical protein